MFSWPACPGPGPSSPGLERARSGKPPRPRGWSGPLSARLCRCLCPCARPQDILHPVPLLVTSAVSSQLSSGRLTRTGLLERNSRRPWRSPGQRGSSCAGRTKLAHHLNSEHSQALRGASGAVRRTLAPLTQDVRGLSPTDQSSGSWHHVGTLQFNSDIPPK